MAFICNFFVILFIFTKLSRCIHNLFPNILTMKFRLPWKQMPHCCHSNHWKYQKYWFSALCTPEWQVDVHVNICVKVIYWEKDFSEMFSKINHCSCTVFLKKQHYWFDLIITILNVHYWFWVKMWNWHRIGFSFVTFLLCGMFLPNFPGVCIICCQIYWQRK